MKTIALENGYNKPSVFQVMTRILSYVSMMGIALVIALQFPDVVYRAALLPHPFWTFCIALPALSLGLGLFFGMTNSQDKFESEVLLGSMVLTAVLVAFMLLVSLIKMTSLDHVGMYNLSRLDSVVSFEGRIKKINPHAMQHPDNQLLVFAQKDPTPLNLHRAYRITQRALDGQDYRNVMSALALLGMNDSIGYRRGLARGWLSETDREVFSRHLRANPPDLKVLNDAHAAAYLFLVGASGILPEKT